MSDETRDGVLEIVARVAGVGRVPTQPDLSTPLRDGYWLDSMELLDVVLACESRFGVAFVEGVDLTPENLATVGTLVGLIERRRVSGHV
jgi:acyl carrier protein